MNVDVLVTGDGGPVRGLSADNFEVKDNGVSQVLDSVSTDRVQLDVACVLGPAARANEKGLSQQSTASQAVVAAFAPEDHVQVVPFTSALELQEFTAADRVDFRQWLDAVPAQRGLRPMRDALFVAMTSRHSHPGRFVVVLLSDGLDGRSWTTREQVLEVARRTDVVVYVVKARREWPQNLAFVKADFLDDLAAVTGGRVIPAEREELRSTMSRLLEECRARYVVSFQPRGPMRGWHTLEVRLKGAAGRVMARRGYWME